MATRTEPRLARAADAARVTEIMTLAFNRDPVWGWAFPDERRRIEQHTVFWGYFVEAAIPHESVWLTGDGGAAALWVPPGTPELSPEAEAELDAALPRLVGDAQASVLGEVFARFAAAHPHDRPHHYLSLLGTHPDHRGRGLGMNLLADNLDRLDAAGADAYLESTNPGNHARYERLGFRHLGEFELPHDGPAVATMWRDAEPPTDRAQR